MLSEPAPETAEAATVTGLMLRMRSLPGPPSMPTTSETALPGASAFMTGGFTAQAAGMALEKTFSFLPARLTWMFPAAAVDAASTVMIPECSIASFPQPPRIPAAKDSAREPPVTAGNFLMKGRVNPSMLTKRVREVIAASAFEERVPLLTSESLPALPLIPTDRAPASAPLAVAVVSASAPARTVPLLRTRLFPLFASRAVASASCGEGPDAVSVTMTSWPGCTMIALP
jgi:hypothetical protein